VGGEHTLKSLQSTRTRAADESVPMFRFRDLSQGLLKTLFDTENNVISVKWNATLVTSLLSI